MHLGAAQRGGGILGDVLWGIRDVVGAVGVWGHWGALWGRDSMGRGAVGSVGRGAEAQLSPPCAPSLPT